MHKEISLKFKKSYGSDLMQAGVQRIRQFLPGVISIEPVFPDTDKAELKLFYILQVDPAVLDYLLIELGEDPNVELAFEPPTRTL